MTKRKRETQTTKKGVVGHASTSHVHFFSHHRRASSLVPHPMLPFLALVPRPVGVSLDSSTQTEFKQRISTNKILLSNCTFSSGIVIGTVIVVNMDCHH